ncbi:glycoside hydrolase family 99-like domain-containing protein [Ochrobactrum sp. Marseille-Q0166]|uniref:glycoside hydrolase family 99-like domain-containing protein n=1 Tax=Ochrobactrum sp. Marseille-Q0166 TaxID=2761105 RepID=UPI0016555E6A|nr:glycoside hydrolase family 99-like domain-containing protein [Ochrobactrum sp. Marseille-Q0166]MBC8718493.1 glycoside hydrolase family 99-like domain-containing protein [Ochrobactrum sp. Marseille-Q0166]
MVKNIDRLSHDLVICVHNAPNETRACLESVLLNSGDINKIIIVDDASDEETREILSAFASTVPHIKIIRNETAIRYTKAANSGINLSDADIVTLLNSDTIVPLNWAVRTQQCFLNHPELGILGPMSNAASYQSVPAFQSTSTQTAVNELPRGVSVQDVDNFCAYVAHDYPVSYVPLVHGFCFTITRRCIDEVGCFDEELFPEGYGEETDYCFRAADAGFALGVSTDIYVFHSKSKSYESELRIDLMKFGWEKLLSRYGVRRLKDAIKHMELQPNFNKVRQAVRTRYYGAVETHAASQQIIVSAFYLPQFHPIDVNNENWGEGFTEWFNVVRAKPRFPGHVQPKLPGALGFYDLRLPEIHRQQVDLAQQYGVNNFCMYYYRFGKKRIMQKPSEVFSSLGQSSVTYCLCWANESWTRAWDGATSDVILEQTYDEDTLNGLVNDICESIELGSYQMIDGRPVFMIYQVAAIPNFSLFLSEIRTRVRTRTGFSLIIGSVFSLQFNEKHLEHVDFVVQFPPHRIVRTGPRITIQSDKIGPFDATRKDYYESYEAVMETALNSANFLPKMLMGVCPDWDNTPRRQTNAHTLIGSSPELFRKWVSSCKAITLSRFEEGRISYPMIFVNAWNEWAEGAVLEPSADHGYDYLNALKSGLS